MKTLIIGASGMLAQPIIKHFDQAGFELRLFSRSIHSMNFDRYYELIKGDVMNAADLETAMKGCDAVHVSLSKVDETLAMEQIVKAAQKNKVKLISLVSGCTVAEENRWFKMINQKFRAEQTLINSGISYLIFRPTWFFESLHYMVRDGKATILGKQPHPYHWIAANDYARMVTTAYQKPETWNNIFFVLGKESFKMEDLLKRYVQQKYPYIKKVSSVPLGVLKVIATLTGKKELKAAASLFGYFEKTKEMGNATKTNELLGAPRISFDEWIESN